MGLYMDDRYTRSSRGGYIGLQAGGHPSMIGCQAHSPSPAGRQQAGTRAAAATPEAQEATAPTGCTAGHSAYNIYTRTARAPATGHEDLSGGLLFI